MTRIGRRIGLIPARLAPRRFRLFCVGDGRTGTTTLARKFGRYRSAHEVDAARMVPLATQLLTGSIRPEDARRELRRRSWRFNLEVDSANFLSLFAGEIAALHDDALFVLLIRDCFSWLESRIEWFAEHDSYSQIWSDNFTARYGRHDDVAAPAEAALTESGLRPIASYLRYWSELPQRVLHELPEHRVCVVRTEDLDDSNIRLAEFVGVDPSTIDAAHAHRSHSRSSLLATVPAEFIVDRANELCAPLMQHYWGDEWHTLSTRLPHEA